MIFAGRTDDLLNDRVQFFVRQIRSIFLIADEFGNEFLVFAIHVCCGRTVLLYAGRSLFLCALLGGGAAGRKAQGHGQCKQHCQQPFEHLHNTTSCIRHIPYCFSVQSNASVARQIPCGKGNRAEVHLPLYCINIQQNGTQSKWQYGDIWKLRIRNHSFTD